MNSHEFLDMESELAPYIQQLDYNVDQAGKLIGLFFTIYQNISDEDSTITLSEFNKDALYQLVNTAKRLSSYADKFQNKVSEVSKKLNAEFK